MAGGQKKGKSSTIKTIRTIDEKHTELIEHYDRIDNETIPQLQSDRDKLKTYIRGLSENQIDDYMNTKDKIKDITLKIKELKREKKQYFLNANI